MISIINCRKFDKIPKIGPYSIGHAFQESIKNRRLDSMSLMATNNLLENIPLIGEFGLAELFMQSVTENNGVAMFCIMDVENFKFMPLEGELGLKKAYEIACKNKNIDMMSVIQQIISDHPLDYGDISI